MSEDTSLKAPVLALGATSLIGRFAVPRLQAAGVEAFALSRNAPDAPGWLKADLSDPDLAAGLPACPTVISLSPIWLLPPALKALKARGMQRLVAFSSTSVFTKVQSPDAHEQGVAAGKQADGQPLNHLVLADDGFAEFRAERLVGFSELIDGGDVIGRQLGGDGGVRIHEGAIANKERR